MIESRAVPLLLPTSDNGLGNLVSKRWLRNIEGQPAFVTGPYPLISSEIAYPIDRDRLPGDSHAEHSSLAHTHTQQFLETSRPCPRTQQRPREVN